MNKVLQRLALACLWLILAGCQGRSYKGAQRFALSGTVKHNGEMVDAGTIAFLPIAGEQRVAGGAIVDGVYSVAEDTGANAGKYRVEIHWHKRTGKQYFDAPSGTMVDERAEGLPAKFHQDSELTAEVSAKQTTFDFDLKSSGSPPPRPAASKSRIPLG